MISGKWKRPAEVGTADAVKVWLYMAMEEKEKEVVQFVASRSRRIRRSPRVKHPQGGKRACDIRKGRVAWWQWLAQEAGLSAGEATLIVDRVRVCPTLSGFRLGRRLGDPSSVVRAPPHIGHT